MKMTFVKLICLLLILRPMAYSQELKSAKHKEVESQKQVLRYFVRMGNGLEEANIKLDFYLHHLKLWGEKLSELIDKERSLSEEQKAELRNFAAFLKKMHNDFDNSYSADDKQRMRVDLVMAKEVHQYIDDKARSLYQRVENLAGGGIFLVALPFYALAYVSNIVLLHSARERYRRDYPFFYVPSEDDSNKSLLHCPIVSYPQYDRPSQNLKTNSMRGEIFDNGRIKIVFSKLKLRNPGYPISYSKKDIILETTVEAMAQKYKKIKKIKSKVDSVDNIDTLYYEKNVATIKRSSYKGGYRDYKLIDVDLNVGKIIYKKGHGLKPFYLPGHVDFKSKNFYCPKWDQFLEEINRRAAVN